MMEKLAVEKIHPKLIKHVREVAKGKAKAKHPIYDVSEHVGTGKAICRGCGEFVKEGEPAFLFWQAPYDQDHKLHFFRNRSIIHAQGCIEGDLVRCPHCRDEVADGSLGQHVSENHGNRFQWQLRSVASITTTCFKHRIAHCGQCEEDRELEEPHFRDEIKKLLQIEATALSDDELTKYFDEPEGFVEEPDGQRNAAYKPQRETRDIAQEVTDSIIASLEKGVAPWTRPWTSDSGVLPTSVHGRPYRGINLLLLGLEQQSKGYASPYWVTYEQAKKLGGNVKRGEKSTLVTFRKKIQVPDKSNVPEPGQDPKLRTIPLLRQYRVFNLDQTDNVKLTPKLQKAMEPKPQVETLPQLQQIIEGYKGGPPISNRPMHVGLEDAPYYSPSRDEIVLPMTHQFESPESYARTAFHELTHSTGHHSRLNRFEDTGEPRHFGSELYAKEELVAELGSAMLRAHANIRGEDTRSASYIQSWLRALKDDKNLVIGAAGKAQNAVDHILGIDPTQFTNDDEETQLAKESSSWRHTENDGFEMWETTEDPNKFAIIENDDQYDLYVLNGSFDSPEEAKAAAGMERTAQDGGGSGGGGGDGGGGGGDGGSSSGGDGGASAGAGGDASGEGGESSGDAGFSSGTTDSDADSSVNDSDNDSDEDGDEDPRPPSGGHENCPRCGEHLNPIYLVGGRVYTCMNCGFTNRKKKKNKEASWVDRLPYNSSDSNKEPEQNLILSIDPKVPAILEDGPAQPLKNSLNTAELFSMSAGRYRHCVVCGKTLSQSSRGHYTGFCEKHREHNGLVIHEYGSENSRMPHNE